jgi:hypothetical protein
LLILNAQVHDAGKKNQPKTPKINVNLTDLAFEDIKTDETVREINKHDIDPSYGHLEVNVNDTKRSPAKNNKEDSIKLPTIDTNFCPTRLSMILTKMMSSWHQMKSQNWSHTV